jgi:sigma-E factor negative regulatory protein RseC
MLETRAVVVQVEGQRAFVQASQSGGCGQCSGKGCGTAKLSQLFCSQLRQFQVDNPINARVGDQVVVSVADGTVLRGIGLVYLLPLLLLAVGAALGNVAAPELDQRDGYAAAGAFVGLACGFVLSKWLAVRLRRQRPYIARQWRGE